MRQLILVMLIGINSHTLLAQATNSGAPGAPGLDAHWLTAAKNGFGTSTTLNSKVWFTLTEGVLSEVYYPRLDVPNVQSLQLIVVQGNRVQAEVDTTTHQMNVLGPLTFRQINTARDNSFTISKTYVTDPARNTLMIDVVVHWKETSANERSIYLHYDPSLNNSGMHDSAWSFGKWLLASDSDKASALTVINARLDKRANSYVGPSDGLSQLTKTLKLSCCRQAFHGNVSQTARVLISRNAFDKQRFTIVLAFGRNTSEAIRNGRASGLKGFAAVRSAYENGWRRYVRTLPKIDAASQTQFNMAAIVLRGLEDKTYRGAMIASPSIPWGGGANANETGNSGYHAVWSRDLYHVATAFQAIGDRSTAQRALDYLFTVQQRADGSFPQNSWLDGRPIGGAVQMDEVAFPIILAQQLGRTDRTTWLRHIKPAADYLLAKGPSTEQERWEEESGFSPSTIAAEIAGLVCAADIARKQGNEHAATAYLRTADDWRENLEKWTATRTGPYADGNYYLRINADNNSNDGNSLEINSGGGSYDERAVIDAGFLELVRLGIKASEDPLVRKSIAAIDSIIKVETPAGSAWYRYNHDAYGERPDGGAYDGQHGSGRLWALLTGERGEYDLANGEIGQSRHRLDTMRSFANDGMMIPEQIWDRQTASNLTFRFGAGTGSATPLAWSMAQFIRLAMNLQRGRNLEMPQVVFARYVKDREKSNERLK